MDRIDRLLAEQFPVSQNLLYLNHAAVAPWPLRTAEAIHSFTEENLHSGAQHYPQWLEVESRLRQQAVDLTGAQGTDDIALIKNTSEGLSMVAHGLPWQAGDNVVISDQEFPSNRIAWESLRDQGVEVREVTLPCPGDAEQALIDACDARTRVLSISTVQYASGLAIDLKRLGDHCHQNGIAFCVDAIQGLGVVPHDVQTMHIDFLVADGHKWLLAPEGLAIFYCAPRLRETLKLHEYGWHMLADPYAFGARDWQPASSGRRFECGSPNMLGVYALSASLGLLLEIGIDEIHKRVLARTEYLFEQIQARSELELLSCTEPGRYAGIAVFRNRKKDSQALYQGLMEQDVICAPRGGGIRFSPHCYTPMETLDRAVALAAG